MTPDTMQRLAAQRERMREVEHARLAARRPPWRRTFVPRLGQTIGHLLAAHRRPVTR